MSKSEQVPADVEPLAWALRIRRWRLAARRPLRCSGCRLWTGAAPWSWWRVCRPARVASPAATRRERSGAARRNTAARARQRAVGNEVRCRRDSFTGALRLSSR